MAAGSRSVGRPGHHQPAARALLRTMHHALLLIPTCIYTWRAGRSPSRSLHAFTANGRPTTSAWPHSLSGTLCRARARWRPTDRALDERRGQRSMEGTHPAHRTRARRAHPRTSCLKAAAPGPRSPGWPRCRRSSPRPPTTSWGTPWAAAQGHRLAWPMVAEAARRLGLQSQRPRASECTALGWAGEAWAEAAGSTQLARLLALAAVLASPSARRPSASPVPPDP